MRASCSAVRSDGLRCLAAAAVGRPRGAVSVASTASVCCAARAGPSVRLRPNLAGGCLARGPAHAIRCVCARAEEESARARAR